MVARSRVDGPTNGDKSKVAALFAEPAEFIRWAARIVPGPTKFVLGGVIVFAGVVLILGWVRSYSLWTVVGIAIVIVVLGLVVGALSSLSASSRKLFGVGSFLAHPYTAPNNHLAAGVSHRHRLFVERLIERVDVLTLSQL